MGGINVILEVNNDEKLTIDTTVHMEDSENLRLEVMVFLQS